MTSCVVIFVLLEAGRPERMKVTGTFVIVWKRGLERTRAGGKSVGSVFGTFCELFEIFISLALLYLRK